MKTTRTHPLSPLRQCSSAAREQSEIGMVEGARTVQVRVPARTSMVKAESDLAKKASRSKSSVAPRLSLLLTNTYLMPLLRRRPSMPLPSRLG